MATETVNVVVDMSINTGKMLWVDSVYGNDSTGTPDRFDLPYLTPTAAKAAATVGDLVHVGPGAFAITENLAKDGVDWYFESGCFITMDQSQDNGIFDDVGTGMAFNVRGFGDFHMTSTTEDHAFVHAINVRHADSVVYVHGRKVLASTTVNGSDSSGAIASFDGNLKSVFTDTIESNGKGYTVYWENGGMFIQSIKIKGRGNGAITSNCQSDPTGKFWVQADEVTNDHDGPASTITDASTHPDAQVWIRVLEARNDGVGNCVYVSGVGKVYVEAQKISASSAHPVIKQDGAGRAWIKTMKISGGSKFIEIGAGTLYFDCQQYEQGDDTVTGIDVQGGQLFTDGGVMILDGADGINISGGDLNASGLTVDTSTSSSNNPVVKSGGTLTLNQCTLIAEATRKSVEGASVSFTSRGSTIYQPLAATVTVDGDLFYDQGGPSDDQVPTANADGTWSWAAGGGGAVDSVNGQTGAVDLDTSDIDPSTDRNYVTDAQQTVIGNTSGTNTGDQTNISGNAATVTTNANLTGPVTSVGNATAIADAALSIAKTSGLQTALDALKPLPFNGMIEAPVNKTYVVCEAAPFAFTINTLIAKLQSGTLSAAIQINGTPVTGINTLAVTSTQGTGTATAANAVSVGQRVTLVVTSASAPNDLSWTLKYTR